MFERPGGREFAPALAERGRGQSGICRTAALSAARMDTDGPPDGHGRAPAVRQALAVTHWCVSSSAIRTIPINSSICGRSMIRGGEKATTSPDIARRIAPCA